MEETGSLKSMGVADTPENRAKSVATMPPGRLARPDDVANACVYLASDAAESIIGRNLTS
jgi:3-oxoacyl-[acyl-carrier protein] reductase